MATYFFWDEIEDNVIREYDDNNNTIAHYTTEPELYGRVISQDRSGQVRHYKYDGQGNTVSLTDNSGNVTDTRKYSAFGEVTESTGTTDVSYQWGGRWGCVHDSTFTLSVRRRSINISTGRWRELDPLEYNTGASAYVLVNNRPTLDVDPSGMLSIIPIGPRVDSECGGPRFDAFRWRFSLNQKAPCDGYIVQKVEVWCSRRKQCCCDAYVDYPDGPPDVVLFEAWHVTRNRDSVDPSKYPYDDRFSFECSKGVCTQYQVVAEARFYCSDGRNDPHHQDAHVDVNSSWRPRAYAPCNTDTGDLPSIPGTPGSDPPWWRKQPVEPPEFHSIFCESLCCDGDSDFCRCTGKPNRESVQ